MVVTRGDRVRLKDYPNKLGTVHTTYDADTNCYIRWDNGMDGYYATFSLERIPSYPLNVTKAVIVVGQGPDKITLSLGTFSPYPNINTEPTASVSTEPGHGKAWVDKVFPGMPVDVVDISSGKITKFNQKG